MNISACIVAVIGTIEARSRINCFMSMQNGFTVCKEKER